MNRQLLKSSLFLSVFILYPIFIFSQAQNDPPSSPLSDPNDNVKFIKGAGIVSENDVFFPVNNADKNYTGQFKFEIYTKGFLDKGLWLAAWKLNNTHDSLIFKNVSVFVHGLGYTPSRSHFADTGLVTTERPFGSYLCWGIQRSSGWINKEHPWRGFSMAYEYTFGKIGSRIPGRVQNFLHEYVIVGSNPVEGWDHQIASPGRFAFYARTIGTYNFWKLTSWKKFKGLENDNYVRVGVRYDAMCGYFMDYFKGGILFSTRDLALGSVSSSGIASLKGKTQKKKHQYAFDFLSFEFLPSLKYVFHNAMLQGHKTEGYASNSNQGYSEYVIPDDRINRVVLEFAFRAKLYLRNYNDNRMFVFTYGANWRSREFQGGDDNHFYGTIAVQTFKLK